MKHILQILLFFFTWFSSCAIAQLPKVGLRNYAVSFSTTENQNPENKLKIDICNFARSGISENSVSQKNASWDSYLLEETRARMSLEVVNTAGNFLKTLVITVETAQYLQ